MKFTRRIGQIAILLIVCGMIVSCSTVGKLENRLEKTASLDDFFASEGIPQYISTLPVLYNTGTEWNERSLELIAAAEDYILISIFLGNLHWSTQEVWDLLAQRMKEGVRVYCIIDSSSYFQLDPDTDAVVPAVFNHLRELGIPTVEYNPFSLSHLAYIPKMFDRDHRKYWIVDGTYLALGGINVNYTSLGLPPETGNIDTMAEVVSPGAIEELVGSFVTTWNSYSPNPIAVKDFSVRQDFPQDSELTSFWLVDHYWPQKSQVTAMFDAVMLQAQDELWMMQGYAFLTPALVERIKFAVDRGVEVHVVLSDFARKENYELAALYGILDLIDVGAHVYIYRSPIGAFLHLKLMVADARLTSIGSANYNLRSQTLSREISYIFDDVRVGSAAMAHVEDIMTLTREVSREEALRYRNLKGYLYFLLMQVWG